MTKLIQLAMKIRLLPYQDKTRSESGRVVEVTIISKKKDDLGV